MKKIVLPLLIIVPMITMSFTTLKRDQANLEVEALKLDNTLIASMDINGLTSFSEKDKFDKTTAIGVDKGSLYKSSFTEKDKTQIPDPVGPTPPDIQPLKIIIEKYI